FACRRDRSIPVVQQAASDSMREVVGLELEPAKRTPRHVRGLGKRLDQLIVHSLAPVWGRIPSAAIHAWSRPVTRQSSTLLSLQRVKIIDVGTERLPGDRIGAFRGRPDRGGVEFDAVALQHLSDELSSASPRRLNAFERALPHEMAWNRSIAKR